MEVDHPGFKLAAAIIALLAALAAQPAAADQLRVLSQNLNRLFDDIDNGNDAPLIATREYRARVARAADKFAADFPLPHLVALQEVENEKVLRDLADAIYRRHAVAYRPLMATLENPARINTGYLVHPQLSIRGIAPLFVARRFVDTEPLFSRPPLRLDVCLVEHCLTVLNLHLRSMRGIDSARAGKRVAVKRREQAQAVAAWVDRQQRADPAAALMVLGDFNALTPSDRHVDVAGIIRGNPDNARTRFDSPDLVEPDLVDLTRRIPRHRRYSYIYRRNRQQLDYLFANRPLAQRIVAIRYDRIDYSFSDHAGLFARFRWP